MDPNLTQTHQNLHWSPRNPPQILVQFVPMTKNVSISYLHYIIYRILLIQLHLDTLPGYRKNPQHFVECLHPKRDSISLSEEDIKLQEAKKRLEQKLLPSNSKSKSNSPSSSSSGDDTSDTGDDDQQFALKNKMMIESYNSLVHCALSNNNNNKISIEEKR